MTDFSTNKTRLDPYKNFKFRIVWGGRTVAGVTHLSGLRAPDAAVVHRAGGDPSTPHLAPGQTAFEPITLEQGLTCDSEFVAWVNRIWEYTNTTQREVSLEDFRKNIVIEMYNEVGQRVLAYDIHSCWPSEYTALPELDGEGNAFAIQSLVLQHEGWERDERVAAPTD